jgi:hypothetical protein
MSTPEENKPAKSEVPVQRSFVGVPQEEPEKKLTSSELLVRMYEVEMYIGKTLKDLTEIVVGIKDLLSKQPVRPDAQQKPTVAPVQQPVQPAQTLTPDIKLAKILASFPEEILNLININSEENNMFYIIKPKQFLGSENFAKIASTVRALGGEYVSQGKESHFRISKAT